MINMLMIILLCVGTCSVSSTEMPFNMDDMDDAEIQNKINCFFAILCDARKPLEFRRIMCKAHPELIKKGFVWLYEINGINGTDTPEFWECYPDHKCGYSEEKKKEVFCEWIRRLGEYWAHVCANEKDERCVMMGLAEHEYNVVTAEYHANRVCQAAAGEGAEKAASKVMG